MFALPILTAALIGAAPTTHWCRVSFDSWTKDGTHAVWEAELCNEVPQPKVEGRGYISFRLVTNASGALDALFGGTWEEEGMNALPWSEEPRYSAVRDLVRPDSAFAAWRRAHGIAETNRVRLEIKPGEEVRTVEGLTLAVTATGSGCETVSLRIGAKTDVVLMQDRCLPQEPAHAETSTYVHLGWSPDRTRLALSWLVRRETNTAAAGEDRAEGMDVRSYLAIIPRRALLGEEPFQTITRTLSPIDLLDAGAGAKLDPLSKELQDAGFRVAHRGKAGKPRVATEVFHAPGYRLEALEAARVAGAPPEAVKPLSWKSPFPIVVAAGSER